MQTNVPSISLPTWRPVTSHAGKASRNGLAQRRTIDRKSRNSNDRCDSAPESSRCDDGDHDGCLTYKMVPVPTIGRPPPSRADCRNKSYIQRVPSPNVAVIDDFNEEYDFDKCSDGKDDLTFVIRSQHKPDEKDENAEAAFNYKKQYEGVCRRLKKAPVESFIRQMAAKNETQVDLRNKLLSPMDIKGIAITLVNHITIQKLDLSGNEIGPSGMKNIAELLRENQFITHLDLSSTNPGKEEIKVLSEVVQANRSLKILKLSGNRLDIGHAKHIANIIANNDYLQHFDLSYNRLGQDEGQLLGPAIGDNISLQELNLCWNHLRMRGAIAVCKGIENNNRLEKIDLSWNGFGTEGCAAMATALSSNQSLIELNMASNRIDIKSVETLMEGVAKNDTLEVLNLGLNPMTTDGAMVILNKLKETPSSKIQEVDITDVPVDMTFVELLEEIQTNRALRVKHGRAFRVNDIRQLEDKNGFQHYDPLMILYQYMKEDNLRLIDIFHSFDTNRDDCLSREEFRDGFMAVNIPITDHALDVLINKLDVNADGKVDFTELGQGHKTIRRKVSTLLHKMRETKMIDPGASSDDPKAEPFSKLEGLVKDAVTSNRNLKRPTKNSPRMETPRSSKEPNSKLPALSEQSEQAAIPETAGEEADLIELAKNLRQLFKRHKPGSIFRMVFQAKSAFQPLLDKGNAMLNEEAT